MSPGLALGAGIFGYLSSPGKLKLVQSPQISEAKQGQLLSNDGKTIKEA